MGAFHEQQYYSSSASTLTSPLGAHSKPSPSLPVQAAAGSFHGYRTASGGASPTSPTSPTLSAATPRLPHRIAPAAQSVPLQQGGAASPANVSSCSSATPRQFFRQLPSASAAVPMATPCFTSRQAVNQGSFKQGDSVEVRWGNTDSWFPATISRDMGDGTFLVDWPDGSQRGRTKRIEDLRRTSSVGSPKSSSTPQARPRAGSGAASFSLPAACATTTQHVVSQATPQATQTRPAPVRSAATAVADAVALGAGSGQNLLDASAATAAKAAPRPASPRSSPCTQASPTTGIAQDQASDAKSQQAQGSEVAGSDAGSDRTLSAAEDPADVAETEAAVKDVAETEVAVKEPEVGDVKVFMVETKTGETAVMVESQDGKKKWRFMRNSIDFELQCTAESLQAWLDGMETQQLPGLLTLLANEVNARGGNLKSAEKDRDALRGTEDYEFFGLDGSECTDKDIERAYRKKSTQLHPDKGGDEESFNQMREKYDQLKSLRSENKRKEGGGSIQWDAKSRTSMLQAHRDLREQLVWIARHMEEVEEELKVLRLRQSARCSLTWTAGESAPTEPQNPVAAG